MNRDAEECRRLQTDFASLRAAGEIEQSLKVEREYLELRRKMIDAVILEVNERKSIYAQVLIDRVRNKPPIILRETGITNFDREMVNVKNHARGIVGGIGLGNFIVFAGSRGAGKTTMVMKIMSNMSINEKVGWFDFEMGEDKAVDTLDEFKGFNLDNLTYYDGSRELNDVIDEIMFLYADGFRYFIIDSMMKIKVTGRKKGYESIQDISAALSEITSGIGINIIVINQISQDSQRNGHLLMKHGNDIEYDADMIFYILKKPTGDTDEFGQPTYDDGCRMIVCEKNRETKRTFKVEVPLFQITNAAAYEIEYEE